MSHKTGIKSNDELLSFFSKCKRKSSKIRFLKVSITNEELILDGHKDVKRDWESDFNRCISYIEENTPCYILYRLDDFNKTVDSYFWMLVSWTPDSSTTREKMIYASTKSTLKQEFGTTNLKEEYHVTCLDEMNLEGYRKNKLFQQASTPLTQREHEINEMRRTEIKSSTVGLDVRHQTMGGGINCPVSEAALQAINDIQHGSYNYIQFSIDLDKEEINICLADNIEVTKLNTLMPTDHARFHIYLFKHYYEGDYQEAYIFIYSMASNCSVKEKMMYSSCKAPFSDRIHTLGITFTKKLEVDDPSELSEENLLDELYPKKMIHKTQFAKPVPPSKRGPRRLIK